MSEAWWKAAEYLLGLPGHRSSHLLVSVADPLGEVKGVREIVDRLFIGTSKDVSTTIERVADTLFPIDYYDEDLECASEKLFELRELAREFESLTVPKGNYFDHFCAYPFDGGEFNQLRHVLNRLRSAKGKKRNLNQCEIGVSEVGKELEAEEPEAGGELRVQRPGKHRSPLGFPCLSHISVTLADGKIDLAATYRAQDFTTKGYGNLLGLGRLSHFLAKESGFEVGEVLCVATGALLQKSEGNSIASVVGQVGKVIQSSRDAK